MGYITGEDRNQIILFPESIDEQVSDNNSIRIIDEYINQLNLKKLARHLKYLDEKIEGYLKELDDHDQIESSNHQPDAKEIRERIQQLKERKEKYESYQRKLKQSGENEIFTTDPD